MKFHTESKQMKLKAPHLRKTPPLVSGKIFCYVFTDYAGQKTSVQDPEETRSENFS